MAREDGCGGELGLEHELDLDPDGSRVLALGDRTFRVGFDAQLVPFVIAASDGKRLADLPKAKGGGGEAAEIWKALKKDAKAIAQTQIHRFERAMITQRRWPASELKTLFIDHPLMFHLVRRFVWATFDGERLKTTFRVAEDRSLANIEDDAFHLDANANANAVVGLPHRLELTDADARQWGELFGNYEIVQPFPQLAREVFVGADADLARFTDIEVSTKKLLGLTSRGWTLGPAQDGGWIWSVIKSIPATDLFVSMSVSEGGLYVPNISESPAKQRIGSFAIVHQKRGTSGVLNAIQSSELARDLDWLRDY